VSSISKEKNKRLIHAQGFIPTSTGIGRKREKASNTKEAIPRYFGSAFETDFLESKTDAQHQSRTA